MDPQEQEPSTEQRREKIATFRAVTAVDNDADAERVLQSSSWQLDQAVSSFLDHGVPDVELHSSALPTQPSVEQPRQQPTANAGAVQQHSTNSPGTRVQVNRLIPALRWLSPLFSPFRVVWSFISNLTTQIFNFLSGPAHLIEASPGSTPARRFLSFYESRYGTDHPDFFDGSYQAALATASEQLKFLIVYIHSESHRLTPTFCRSVMANPEFISTANESFIIWAGSVTQRDAATVYHALRASALPYLAVVAAPPNRSAQAAAAAESAQADGANMPAPFSRMNYGAVLSQRAGHTSQASSGQAAVSWLQRVLQRHVPMLDAIRLEREERESARLLRQQQDEEYAAALEVDRRAEQAAEEKRNEEQRERDRLEELEVRRERKRVALGEEPTKGPGIATVVIRLPDGTRASRRFEQTDVLEKVFDWAEVNRVDIEVASLVVAFPRRSFKYPEDAALSISEAGLFPSGMLLLEERSD